MASVKIKVDSSGALSKANKASSRPVLAHPTPKDKTVSCKRSRPLRRAGVLPAFKAHSYSRGTKKHVISAIQRNQLRAKDRPQINLEGVIDE